MAVEFLRKKPQPGPAVIHRPHKVRTAVHGMLEPVSSIMRNAQIEKNRDCLLLLASELANLEVPGVSRGSPVDVTRALEELIRTEAIEV